jgi:hypothetical protein
MANYKYIYLPHTSTGTPGICARVCQLSTGLWLDHTDGVFRAIPALISVPAVELVNAPCVYYVLAGMSNPMLAVGDLIYASVAGTPATPAHLHIGTTAGQVLETYDSGAGVMLPRWGAGGSGGASDTVITFSISGTLSAGMNKVPSFIVPFATVIKRAYAYVRTNPEGGNIVIDVNVNGVTIWSPSPKLSILASSHLGEILVFNTSVLAVNDILDIDLDSVGVTIAGADLTVQLTCGI